MASHAVAAAASLALPAAAPARAARVSHCDRGAVGCDECLKVLALVLATELGFDQHEALEMSPAWYLAQMGAGVSCMEQAIELRNLTAGLCTGLELIAAAEQQAPQAEEVPPAPRRFNPLFWVVVCAAGWVLAALAVTVVTIGWRR